MSRTFKAITDKKIDWQLLHQEAGKYRDDVQYINKNPVYYFYHNKFSARGVDVSEEEGGYEIRTTSCSNAADYLLANNLATAIKEMTGADFMDEEDRLIFIGTLFDDLTIAKHTYGDIEILKSLLAHKEDITLFGPNRPFHIQREFTKRINALEGDKQAIAYQFSQMMLRCQYPPGEFTTGQNFIEIGDKEGDKYYVQGFFNTHDMILENVKGIILGVDREPPLCVEPKHLVQFLPDSWELLDEFTIAARVLPPDYWKAWCTYMVPFKAIFK